MNHGPKCLSAKERLFVDYYIQTGNADKSYVLAGYSNKGGVANAESGRIAKRPRVAAAIEARQKEIADKRLFTLIEGLEYLADVMRDPFAGDKLKLQALDRIARLNGWNKDKVDITSGGERIRTEIVFIDTSLNTDNPNGMTGIQDTEKQSEFPI